MEDFPEGFIDIVSASSIDQCKLMLMHLHNVINQPKTSAEISDFNQYVSHTTNIINDTEFKNLIIAEATELGIIGKESGKVKTQWLSEDPRDYCFSDNSRFRHPPKPISNYQGISKLLEIVNAHPDTTQNLDSALLLGYNTSSSSINFHDDGEKLINQSASLAIVSFGCERRLEFCHQGGPRIPEYSLVPKEGDLTVMSPGCQQTLLHRVCPGPDEKEEEEAQEETTEQTTPSWRFSISFRKVSNPPDDPEISFNPPIDGKLDTSIATPISKVSLIVGDSISEGLDSIKLGRKDR